MTDSSFWAFQFKDTINVLVLVVTIYAIYIGPIKAAELSIRLQAKKEKEARRHAVFKSLMQTRDMPLVFEHVSALNLIQLEFNEDTKVLDALKTYISILNSKFPDASDPHVFEIFHKDKKNKLYDLIHEIGKSVGYTFDKRELEDLSYSPIGWNNDDQEMRTFRNMVIELLSGRRSLPVTGATLPNPERFPPPPA